MRGTALNMEEPSVLAVMRTVFAATLVIVLALASLNRNATWHSLLSLWEDCARKSPQKSRTHNNLGNCHLLLGGHFPAIEEYRKAVELDAGNMEAQYNLATTLETVGLISPAQKPYDLFCRHASPSEYAAQRATACRRAQEIQTLAGERTRP